MKTAMGAIVNRHVVCCSSEAYCAVQSLK